VADIPFERLGIPEKHRKPLEPGTPVKVRLAAASGKLPMPPQVGLAVAFVLLGDSESSVADQAKKHLCSVDQNILLGVLERNTHPKILEFLAEFRGSDDKVLERIVSLRQANNRTMRLVAQYASKGVLEALSMNQERLLTQPELYEALLQNAHFVGELRSKVEAFLRMHKMLEPAVESGEASQEPEKTAPKKPSSTALKSKKPIKKISLSGKDLQSEIEAALSGTASAESSEQSLGMFDLDALGLGDAEESRPGQDDESDQFEFSFDEEGVEFSLSLVSEEQTEQPDEDEVELSLEQKIAEMTVGQKIKLAYKGNQSVRKLLLRDSNKLVSAAVVKSGRMTDGEILSTAGNRNVPTEILNHIARDKEQMRKYPIRVALATNPKTPIPVALKLLRNLSKADLRSLSQNRNVSGVVFETANRLYKQKYQN